jgi:hypothetical protein
MVAPPLKVGAIQLTVDETFPTVAVTDLGASGCVAGTTDPEVAPGPVPRTLVATTVKVYVVPFVSAVTVQLVVAVVQVRPSGDEVTV